MSELDSTLSSIIIILLIIVVWKWYGGGLSCGQSSMNLSCGCTPGRCRCGMTRGCPGGHRCLCGCSSGRCGCPSSCPCQKVSPTKEFKEGLTSGNERHGVKHVTGSGPQMPPKTDLSSNYQDIIKTMSLENGVDESHKRYCDSLSFAGMPTGASACTTLEETGRSYGTANFVGLTARKFCKARQLATPADDARVTPSHDVVEWCDIDMDEII
jgi:hypothetical protein